MNSRVLFVLFAFSVPAIIDAADVPPNDAIVREILATNARMLAAGNSRDVAAFFAFMTDDSVIVQNGHVFPNREAAVADVTTGYQGVRQIERVLENPQVTVLSPDAALLVSAGRYSATLNDGRTISGRFAVSLVFVRAGDAWKVKLGHYSAPLAPT